MLFLLSLTVQSSDISPGSRSLLSLTDREEENVMVPTADGAIVRVERGPNFLGQSGCCENSIRHPSIHWVCHGLDLRKEKLAPIQRGGLSYCFTHLVP